MRKVWNLSVYWLAFASLLLSLAPFLSGCGPKNSDDDGAITPAPPSTSISGPLTVTTTGSLTDMIDKTSHLSLLKTAVARAGLGDDLKANSLTLFAPTDDAFRAAGYTKNVVDTLPAADLKRLLQYHLLTSRLSGSSFITGTSTSVPTALVTATLSLFKALDGQQYVNAARVVQPDIGANNSVMYVLDKVLPIPSQTTVELLRATADLSFFRLAVERVGNPVSAVLLSPTDRGITVFAPSNAAFRAAGYTTEDAVRSADVARLTEILRYHIINNRAFSPTLRTGELTTVQGTALAVAITAKGITVTGKGNPAVAGNLLQTDLTCTNGVVHVIDRVLLPMGVGQ
jgi:uncharacterized surface protein with fasciclin (FAS1) repeats